jgi:enediyne biosynthesis protein E4
MKFLGRFLALITSSLVLAQTTALAKTSETSFVFTDVSEAAGISATHRAVWDPEGTQEGYLAIGQAWGDYDHDGFLDLYVTGNLDDNVLYKNNGDGTFSLSPLAGQVSLPDVMSGGAIWADYDNDGWQDLYVLNFGANALFHNDAGKGFTDVTAQAGVGDTGKGVSATWGDYDEDGYLDLYVVNWACLPECGAELLQLYRDRLYHNNGDGTFSDMTDLLEFVDTVGAGFAASFADYDNDGDVDLYVVNDKMSNPIGNVLWRNDGAGCEGWCWHNASDDSKADPVMHGMGLAVGDYDNDLDLDFYVSNMMGPMVLLENDGGIFSDVAQAAGVGVGTARAVGWGTAFFDYDNDGWQDLYLAASGTSNGPPGFYSGSTPDMEDFINPYPDALFRNNRDGTFGDVSKAALGETRASLGFAYADYDNDGRLDFVLGNWNEGYRLYHNEGDFGHHWLSVRLTGAGAVNRDAVGSRVFVTTTDGRVQMQEVICGSGLGAGNDLALYFGLGKAEVAEVKVVWPNGQEQVLQDVTSDETMQLSYTATASD